MHEILVNRLRGLSLPRKSVVRLTDRPDMTLDVTVDAKQQHNNNNKSTQKVYLSFCGILMEFEIQSTLDISKSKYHGIITNY